MTCEMTKQRPERTHRVPLRSYSDVPRFGRLNRRRDIDECINDKCAHSLHGAKLLSVNGWKALKDQSVCITKTLLGIWSMVRVVNTPLALPP